MKLPRRAPNQALQAELAMIAAASKASLRERYRELFQRDPPRAFSPDLLRRSVAHRLQENAYGSLPKATQRELKRLVRLMIEKPDAKLTIPRRAQSGTALIRDWKGKRHEVVIQAHGFSYAGREFSNLSEIARLITGTRWNGPRFFGLRRGETNTDSGLSRTKSGPEATPNVGLPASTAMRSRRLLVGNGL